MPWPLVHTLVGFAAWMLARHHFPRLQRGGELGLAALLMLTVPLEMFSAPEVCIPLHLCDIAAIFGSFALLRPRRLPTEMVVFWGLGATLQALITPAVHTDESFLQQAHYWILHAGVVLAALHCVFARGFRPERLTLWRVIAVSMLYQAFIVPINYFANTNYAFQREKPGGGGLMEILGPWPWYLLSLQLLGIAVFWLLHVGLKSLPGKSLPKPEPS